jgi:hypothetical protein
MFQVKANFNRVDKYGGLVFSSTANIDKTSFEILSRVAAGLRRRYFDAFNCVYHNLEYNNVSIRVNTKHDIDFKEGDLVSLSLSFIQKNKFKDNSPYVVCILKSPPKLVKKAAICEVNPLEF